MEEVFEHRKLDVGKALARASGHLGIGSIRAPVVGDGPYACCRGCSR